jgi:hypothetical protein
MTYKFQFLREFGVFGVFSGQIIEVLKRGILGYWNRPQISVRITEFL